MYQYDTSNRTEGPRGGPERQMSGSSSRLRTARPQPNVSVPAHEIGITLTAVWSQRSVVVYGLQRRAALEDLFHGGAFRSDLCDADPYTLRAAKHHGEATERLCPVCRKENLTHLTYVFGDELGHLSGRIRATRELESMAREYGEFTVYVIEVCQNCEWNHMTMSFVLGDGVARGIPRRRRAEA